MEAVVCFQVKVIVVAVDDSDVAEEQMQFHEPKCVAAEIFPDVAC